MDCKNCGNEVPTGSKFCTKCGTPAGADEANGTPASSVDKIKREIEGYLGLPDDIAPSGAEPALPPAEGPRLTGEPRWWFLAGSLLILPALLLPWVRVTDRSVWAWRLPASSLILERGSALPLLSAGIVLLILFGICLYHSLRKDRVITILQLAAFGCFLVGFLACAGGVRAWNAAVSGPLTFEEDNRNWLSEIDRGYKKIDLFLGREPAKTPPARAAELPHSGLKFIMGYCRPGCLFPLLGGLWLIVCTLLFPESGRRLHYRVPASPAALVILAAAIAGCLAATYYFFPAQWFLARGGAWETFGKRQKAIAAYESCAKLPVPPITCPLRLSNLYWKEKRVDKAFALLTDLEKKFPESTGVNRALGDLHYFGRNFWKAAEHYRRYRERKPDTREVNTKLASSLVFIGNDKFEKMALADALRLLKEACDLNPQYETNSGIQLRIGEILVMGGEWNEAVPYYKNAADLLPGDFDIQVQTAKVLIKAEDFENAVAYYERSIQLRPEASLSHIAIGDIHRDRYGNRDKAIEWYRKAIEVNEFSTGADVARERLGGLGIKE